MSEDPLQIISNVKEKKFKPLTSKNGRRQEAQAKFERLWLINPEQFDPNKNCIERIRIDRTWNLMNEFINPQDKKAVDLGCGYGLYSLRLAEAGAEVDAVDIAKNALKHLDSKKNERISIIQDYVPKTSLKDDEYDIVAALDLIAYLPDDEYRLFFSELSRLLKSDKGYLICSTLIDINSDDALERFKELIETEFKIEKWIFSYHRLSIRLWNFFESPAKYVKGFRDPEYRHQQLTQRTGFSRWWFKGNSSAIPAFIWSGICVVTTPILKALKQNKGFLYRLEQFSRLFWDEAGISHAICICVRRPLIVKTPVSEQPREMKHKKQLWE